MSKLLSQGGFGCVFYPGIRCNTLQADNRVVTKIQKKDFNSENEIVIGNIINKLSMYQWYFLPVINNCNINLRSLKSPDLMKCDVIASTTEMKQHEYIAMDIPYMDGIEFIKIIESSGAGEIVLILSEAYKHLLTAVEKLENMEIIHMDIKLDNVIFSKNGQPRLIDFGISIPVKELDKKTLNKYFYAYVPEYYVWDPIVHLINYCIHIATKPLTDIDIETVARDCTIGNSSLDIFSPEFVNNYKQTLVQFFDMFKNKELDVTINELLDYKYSWDIYSLGIMYLKLLGTLFINAANGNLFIIMFSQVLLKTIHPDPRRRIKTQKARREFDDIFYIDGDVSNYLNLVTSFDTYRNQVTRIIKSTAPIITPTKTK